MPSRLSTAIDVSAVASAVGIEGIFVNLRRGAAAILPQQLAVIGQGASASSYSTDKFVATSAPEVGARVGYGSPLHLAARMLFPVNGDGVGSVPVTFFPLEDDGSGVAAAGSVTPSGTATQSGQYRLLVNGIQSDYFVVTPDDDVADIITKMVAAVNSVLSMPVIASDGTTELTLTAKWAGLSGNDIYIEVDGPTDLGVTFAISQASGGLVNPDITPALNQFGSTWYTMVLNCLNAEDTDALDALFTFGETRAQPQVLKRLVAFTGNTIADAATAYAISDDRPTDYVNSYLVAPGSVRLPVQVAARQVARIVRQANNNPASSYQRLEADLIEPGADSQQWGYSTRDLAVKAGCSTVTIEDGVVNLSDIVTFYHPNDEEAVATSYRNVVTIVKLQQWDYNMALTFNAPAWANAPLVPDFQRVSNRNAKHPSDAVAAACTIIDQLGNEAIIADPDTAKENTAAEIDANNPNRLNLQTTIQVTGNTNIKSVTYYWGFYFGGTSAA